MAKTLVGSYASFALSCIAAGGTAKRIDELHLIDGLAEQSGLSCSLTNFSQSPIP
jgi:hypothetical protein